MRSRSSIGIDAVPCPSLLLCLMSHGPEVLRVSPGIRQRRSKSMLPAERDQGVEASPERTWERRGPSQRRPPPSRPRRRHRDVEKTLWVTNFSSVGRYRSVLGPLRGVRCALIEAMLGRSWASGDCCSAQSGRQGTLAPSNPRIETQRCTSRASLTSPSTRPSCRRSRRSGCR